MLICDKILPLSHLAIAIAIAIVFILNQEGTILSKSEHPCSNDKSIETFKILWRKFITYLTRWGARCNPPSTCSISTFHFIFPLRLNKLWNLKKKSCTLNLSMFTDSRNNPNKSQEERKKGSNVTCQLSYVSYHLLTVKMKRYCSMYIQFCRSKNVSPFL